MSWPLHKRARALTAGLAVALAAGLGACDSQPTAGTGGGPVVVDGVDLTALFATPSPSEIAAVAAGWAPPARSVTERATLDRGQRETVTVLQATDADGSSALVAVRQPPREPGDQRQRALLVFLPDEPEVDLAAVLSTLPVEPRLAGEFVVAVVTPRGGRLRIDGQTFQAVGAAQSYDPAVSEDVLALIRAVRQRDETFGVDPERVVLMGHGTGGHTATLAGVRTADDDLLFVLAAPTTFVLPSVRDAAQRYLRDEQVGGFPGLRDVLAATVGGVRDGTVTPAEARRQLIARSPALFVQPQASPPAFVFAAYGGRDLEVPLSQGTALDPLIRSSGGLFLALPEAGHESVLQDREVLSTGAAFLCTYVLAGEPVCS